MKTSSFVTALAALVSLSSAHFLMEYPTSRGFNDDTIGTFPCGGFNVVNTTRTKWPLTGGEIALTMADSSTNIEVLIGLGNNVGDGFNTVIRSTFAETGKGAFCMTGFYLPSSYNGMNATIQVVTNGDKSGSGLYNCADITLSSTATVNSSVCTNATGVSTSASTITGNPNATTAKLTSAGTTVPGERLSAGLTSAAGLLLASYIFL